MKPIRSIRLLVCVVLALALLASSALALPSTVRPDTESYTPQAAYERAELLSVYIRSLHIDSGPNDDPLLKAWQALNKTQANLSANQLRRELIRFFGQDPDYGEAFLEFMLHCYDPFSNLFTPSSYEAAYGDDRDYDGVGFVYSAWGALYRIGSVYTDSPAGKAGLKPGDLIVKVSGQDLRYLTAEKREALMASSRGSTFVFTVLRDGELLDFSVTPGHVTVPSVEYALPENGIGYLAIRRFSGEDFPGDLDKAIRALREAGTESLILDLQSNPGGGLDELVAALNAFVPDKGRLLFTELTRSDKTPYYSEGGGWLPENTVVLVNCDSASSAEIFSGCLSDLGLAKVLGEPTYGKGRGQAGYYFEDQVLMISVSAVALPIRGRYDGSGLLPDRDVSVSIVMDPSAFAALPEGRVSESSGKNDILALEQRLALLGFLWEEADGVYDDATKSAVRAACAAFGLTSSDTASAELMLTLAEMAEEMDGMYYHDPAAGIEAARELLEAAKAA